MSTVDPKEVNAAAYLISAAAGRLQAPRRWDEQGIYAVVHRLVDVDGRAPLDIASAATRAIADTAAMTPAALAWSKYYSSSTSAPHAEAEPVCSHCSRSRSAHERIAEWDPHEWTTLAPGGPKRRPLPNWRELLP